MNRKTATQNLFCVAVMLATLVFTSVAVSGQKARFVATCEHVKNRLDHALLQRVENGSNRLQFIFRPGTKERSSKYSFSREKAIIKYLAFRGLKKPDRVEMLHKRAVARLGSVEILINGKSWEIMHFRNNKIGWDGCIE